ncbi:MAG: sugar ABC transporter permease [Armatimonadota bacterium]|jgi:multiple sugar transport system permease protein
MAAVQHASRRKWGLDTPYAFLLPAILIFGAFAVYPILRSLYLSFFSYEFLHPEQMHWVGVANYREIAGDQRVTAWPGIVLPKGSLSVWQIPFYPLVVAWLTINAPGGAFWNSIRFTAMYVPATIVLPLFLAILIERAGRLSAFFRTMNFIPVVVSVAVVSIIWMWIYHPEYGVANTLIRMVPGMGDGFTWLSDPKLAMPAIAAMCVWHGLGFNMLLYLVGLQRIPTELVEAATVDGATGWQAFRRITFPLLKPTMFLVGLLAMIGALKVFGQMLIMTNGGPGDSTLSMVLYLYNIAFRYGKFRFGYASALAWALAVFIFFVSLIAFRLSKERE